MITYEIDPQTKMPAPPSGMFWRVKHKMTNGFVARGLFGHERAISSGGPFHYIEVALQSRTFFRTRTVRKDTIKLFYHNDSLTLVRHVPEPEWSRLILDQALSLLAARDEHIEWVRATALKKQDDAIEAVRLGQKFSGTYPPKKLDL